MRVSIITGGGSGIGAAVAFLLSKDAGHVTGATLPVDRGLALM